MNDWVMWLMATPVSSGLRNLTWLWPICETLHFIGLAMLIGGAGVFDLRLMGLIKQVPIRSVKAFMPYAIAGFAINLLTGIIFFIVMPTNYVGNGAFYAKMLFVIVAGMNAMYFETTQGSKILTMGADETPFTCKVVGALSLFSWFAVMYFGRMLPYLGTGN